MEWQIVRFETGYPDFELEFSEAHAKPDPGIRAGNESLRPYPDNTLVMVSLPIPSFQERAKNTGSHFLEIQNREALLFRRKFERQIINSSELFHNSYTQQFVSL